MELLLTSAGWMELLDPSSRPSLLTLELFVDEEEASIVKTTMTDKIVGDYILEVKSDTSGDCKCYSQDTLRS